MKFIIVTCQKCGKEYKITDPDMMREIEIEMGDGYIFTCDECNPCDFPDDSED